jgi:hypothetical protein
VPRDRRATYRDEQGGRDVEYRMCNHEVWKKETINKEGKEEEKGRSRVCV